MANDIAGKVWVIDTAAATPIATGPIIISGLIYKPNAASDQIIIKNGNTQRTLMDLKANATTAEFQIPILFGGKPQVWDGIAVTTLSASSKLYIYLA